MNCIIQWCNSNQGFLSLVLSVLTIGISVIALVMSYRIGKLPYKMKLAVSPSYYNDNGIGKMVIILVNQGNVDFPIASISVCDNSNLTCAMYGKYCNDMIVKKNGIERIEMEIYDNIEYFDDNAINLNNKIKIKIRDINDKQYIYTKGFPVG